MKDSLVDRIQQVIRKEKNYAVFPIVCADHCAQLLDINFSKVASSGKKLAEVLEYGYNLYQYDMVLVFSDPYVEAQAMGCPIRLDPFPTLTGPKSNQSIDRTDEIIKAAELLKNKLDVLIFVSIKGPFSLAAFLVGMKDFLKMLLKNGEKAKSIIDEALEFQIRYLNRLLSLEVNIFIGDPVASASVISPEVFSTFAYEPLKILVKKIKDKEMISGIHICGETKPIIPMLDTIGTDVLSIEDITPKINTLKMGGISTGTILYGSPAEIRREIENALQEPYLILSTSCDVPVKTNPESIKTMLAFAHEYSKS